MSTAANAIDRAPASSLGRSENDPARASAPVRSGADPTPASAPADRPTPRAEAAWRTLSTVLDPEVPAVSVLDLGIVRDVIDRGTGEALEVVLTPTYSGCPATEAIEHDVIAAIDAAGLGPARATLRRAPAWSSDWISADGREKLRAYGIAPPGPAASDGDFARAAASRRVGATPGAPTVLPIRIVRPPPAPPIACPRCGSADTERLAAFGSTACKALWRCRACAEPFEHFKPI